MSIVIKNRLDLMCVVDDQGVIGRAVGLTGSTRTGTGVYQLDLEFAVSFAGFSHNFEGFVFGLGQPSYAVTPGASETQVIMNTFDNGVAADAQFILNAVPYPSNQ